VEEVSAVLEPLLELVDREGCSNEVLLQPQCATWKSSKPRSSQAECTCETKMVNAFGEIAVIVESRDHFWSTINAAASSIIATGGWRSSKT